MAANQKNTEENLQYYRDMGVKFEKFLRVPTFPVAIKLIRSEKEIPSGSKRPVKDLGFKTAVCQNFRQVRAYGWTIALVGIEDSWCGFANWAYGWGPSAQDSFIKSQGLETAMYAKDIDTAKKAEAFTYRLKGECIGLVISPLSRTKVVPDVVQIFGLPAQIMRVTQSYLFMEGGALEFTSMGRMGSCHLGVIKPHLTNKPQLVTLGNGDRVFGGAQDYEIMVSIPKSKLDTVITGLEATQKRGLRYPIPTYMNYTPGFQQSFAKKAIKETKEMVDK